MKMNFILPRATERLQKTNTPVFNSLSGTLLQHLCLRPLISQEGSNGDRGTRGPSSPFRSVSFYHRSGRPWGSDANEQRYRLCYFSGGWSLLSVSEEVLTQMGCMAARLLVAPAPHPPTLWT